MPTERISSEVIIAFIPLFTPLERRISSLLVQFISINLPTARTLLPGGQRKGGGREGEVGKEGWIGVGWLFGREFLRFTPCSSSELKSRCV